jgi:hypothetical protein
MNTQLSSRLFLLGLSLNASIMLTVTVSPGAFAQAQGDVFSSSGSDDTTYITSDYFSTAGDSFSSRGDTSSSKDAPEVSRWRVGRFEKEPQNSTFEENENVDPNAFTWSDDPRDAFASGTSDNLQQFPLYKGKTKSFTFVSVSDGPQIKPEYQKNFNPPRAFAQPKYSEVYSFGPSLPTPKSGTFYRDAFGHGTSLYGWKVTRQPVRVYFAGDVGDVRDGLVKRVFVECMRQWCGATQGRLKFMVIEDSKSADIIVCREYTSNHELAENLPTFHDAWLDRVKIRLIDSACDKIGEAQLRAVLLHSAGHALGYFEHTSDKNSAMNEQCALVSKPTQNICPCDAAFIKEMYDSYKTCWDNRLKKETIKVTRVPFGQGMPIAALPIGTLKQVLKCPTKIEKPAVPMPHNVQRQRLTIKPPTVRRPST